jgi:8-oxo-dGTP diphosphatase
MSTDEQMVTETQGPQVFPTQQSQRASKKEYVLGFCFMHYMSEVVLIRKNKPEWQKGLLNGVGGKIEPGENPMEAMIREWREETGTNVTDWHRYVTMDFSGATVHVFKHVMLGCVNIQSATDEQVGVFNVDCALANCSLIPNLKWLIPMALYDSQTHEPHWKGAPILKYP